MTTRPSTTAHAGAAADESVLPEWARQDPVVCVDGPMAGHWYTAQDWAARLTSAQAMAERHQRPTPASAYVPTGRRVPHPHDTAVTGTAVAYQPTHHAPPLVDQQDGGRSVLNLVDPDPAGDDDEAGWW